MQHSPDIYALCLLVVVDHISTSYRPPRVVGSVSAESAHDFGSEAVKRFVVVSEFHMQRRAKH